ncbi:MAG: hypothetical protein S4CHLAM6_14630 [Chlamydiae bacterium]|nr:hypothetical protein [Chlamydiota bacterium]
MQLGEHMSFLAPIDSTTRLPQADLHAQKEMQQSAKEVELDPTETLAATDSRTELEEVQAFLKQLEADDKRLDPPAPGTEDARHDFVQDDAPKGEAPQLNLIDHGVNANPIFDETFEAYKHLFNVLKASVGPSALQLKALGPSFAALGSFLNLSIKYGVPGLAGVGGAAASAYFLKSNIEHLVFGDSEQKGALSWAADKVATVAKIGLAGYATASCLGVLGSTTAVSLALAGGGALTYLSSGASKQSEPQSQLSWLGQKAFSTIKVGAAAYGLLAGASGLIGYEKFPGLSTIVDWIGPAIASASTGTSFISGVASTFAATPLLYILPLGLMLGQQVALMKVVGQAFQGLNKELEGYKDAEKHSGTYERLGNISREEYQQVVAEVMGVENFIQIAHLFEPLKSRNPQAPELAARPVIAKLVMLDEEIKKDALKYAELVQGNKLAELEKFVSEEFKPKLFMQTYLKHCIINPARPELGQVSKDGDKYASLVSHLLGQLGSRSSEEDKAFLTQVIAAHTDKKPSDVKFPRVEFSLSALEPNAIIEEANAVLVNEAKLQNIYYQLKLMQEQLMQQMMQAQESSEEVVEETS